VDGYGAARLMAARGGCRPTRSKPPTDDLSTPQADRQPGTEALGYVRVGWYQDGPVNVVPTFVTHYHRAGHPMQVGASGASLRSRSSDSGYGANYRTGWRLLGLFR